MNIELNLLSYILILILILIFRIIYIMNKEGNFSPNFDTCESNLIYNYAILEENMHNIKSGDLIFFIANEQNQFKAFTDNTFSHCGIILKENNILYCVEIVKNIIIDNIRMTGVVKIPLDKRIKTFAGHIYLLSLNYNLNEYQYNKLIELSNMDYYFTYHYQVLLDLLFNYKDDKSHICTSYIYYILNKLNIINCNNLLNYIQINKKIFNIHNNSNIYSEPIELISNMNILDKLQNISVTKII
jgi:permuted papain-like amidase YaeF/Yiix C92 family enzyme